VAIVTAPAVTKKSVLLKLAKPNTLEVAVGIAELAAAVNRPLLSTVNVATEVELP
jgi:hypothetical protein